MFPKGLFFSLLFVSFKKNTTKNPEPLALTRQLTGPDSTTLHRGGGEGRQGRTGEGGGPVKDFINKSGSQTRNLSTFLK